MRERVLGWFETRLFVVSLTITHSLYPPHSISSPLHLTVTSNLPLWPCIRPSPLVLNPFPFSQLPLPSLLMARWRVAARVAPRRENYVVYTSLQASPVLKRIIYHVLVLLTHNFIPVATKIYSFCASVSNFKSCLVPTTSVRLIISFEANFHVASLPCASNLLLRPLKPSYSIFLSNFDPYCNAVDSAAPF